jgi:hypothetical protein
MQSMQSQLERERQRRIIEDKRVKDEQRKAEEQERERLKAEKRAAKVCFGCFRNVTWKFKS